MSHLVRCLCLILGCANPWMAAGEAPPTTVAMAFAQARLDHPRLFADRAEFRRLGGIAPEFPALRGAIATVADLARLAQDHALLERKPDQPKLLETSRKALLLIGTLAADFQWRGDQASALAAKRHLLNVVRFIDWNPGHFLDTAEMTLAVAVGYDWLYDLLSDAERAEIRSAIIDKGLKPSFTTPPAWWVDASNNWSQVCHGGLLAGALVVHEFTPELSRRVVERALTHLPAAMDALYPASGNFFEGPMYWAYGTHYNLIASEALRSVLGTDFGLARHRGLHASGQFLAHVHGPTGKPFCYGDGAQETPWCVNATAIAWLSREANTVLATPGNPRSAWQPSLTNNDNRFLFLLPLWHPPATAVAVDPPLDYLGDGQKPIACFRSAWNLPTATSLGIGAGSPGSNHGHMDVGGFVYDSAGIRWAVDLGMEAYHPVEKAGIDLWNMTQSSSRWQVFRIGHYSHNILILPGGSQNVAGKAVIRGFSADAQDPGCTVDLTPVYAGQAVAVERRVRLPGRRSLVITDHLRGLATAGTVRWQMLTRATTAIDPDGRRFHLTQDGRALDVTLREPAGGRLRVTPAQPSHPWESANKGVNILGIEIPVAAGSDLALTVTCTDAAPEPLPASQP